MLYKRVILATVIGAFLTLSGCSSSDSGAVGGVDKNYPYLTSAPKVTYIQNANDQTKYDVTVTLEADGPSGVFSVSLWLHDKNDVGNFAQMDLQFMGGTTWTATTNFWIPLTAGIYYIDSITIEDGDAFAGGTVKSSWYFDGVASNTHYDIDQRETDWSTVSIINYYYGLSNIPIVNFTLP